MATTAKDRGGATARRGYRSGLREQQAAATRKTILDAASELFLVNGWSATGMREVAAAAGVALETVYSHFSSKRGLLSAVADTAVVGDDVDQPLAARPEFQAMGAGPRAARIGAAAQLLAAVHARTALVATLLRQAAAADAEIAEMLRSTRERQRSDVTSGLTLVLGRPPTTTERDGTWAIVSPEVYLLLVEESGWTVEHYEAWVAATLERVLPDEDEDEEVMP